MNKGNIIINGKRCCRAFLSVIFMAVIGFQMHALAAAMVYQPGTIKHYERLDGRWHLEYTESITYNGNGNVLSERYKWNYLQSDDLIQYSYDNAGKLSQKTYFSFDDDTGRKIKIKYTNYSYQKGKIKEERTYSCTGRIDRLTTKRKYYYKGKVLNKVVEQTREEDVSNAEFCTYMVRYYDKKGRVKKAGIRGKFMNEYTYNGKGYVSKSTHYLGKNSKGRYSVTQKYSYKYYKNKIAKECIVKSKNRSLDKYVYSDFKQVRSGTNGFKPSYLEIDDGYFD